MSEVHSLKSAQGFRLCCLSFLGWKTCSCPVEVDLEINFVFHWSVIRDKCSAQDFFSQRMGFHSVPQQSIVDFLLVCDANSQPCVAWTNGERVGVLMVHHPAHWYPTTLTSKLIDLHPIFPLTNLHYVNKHWRPNEFIKKWITVIAGGITLPGLGHFF